MSRYSWNFACRVFEGSSRKNRVPPQMSPWTFMPPSDSCWADAAPAPVSNDNTVPMTSPMRPIGLMGFSYRVKVAPDGWFEPWMLKWQFAHDLPNPNMVLSELVRSGPYGAFGC